MSGVGDDVGFGNVPVGTVQAWLKSFPNTTSLPDGWMEANGQIISDAESPFNGQTIPNLNGANSSTRRFLRGSTSSGSTGGDETHIHQLQVNSNDHGTGNEFGTADTTQTEGANHLPPYYEVVWIIKIKDNTQGLIGLVGINVTDQNFTSNADNVSNIGISSKVGVNSVIYESWGYIGQTMGSFQWTVEIHDCDHNVLENVQVSALTSSPVFTNWEIPFYISAVDMTPDNCSLGYHLNLNEVSGSATARVNFAKLTKVMD